MANEDDLIADLPSGKIELTDRELAIARGDNPDALTPATPEVETASEPVVEANSEASLENSAGESGKEAAGSTPATAVTKSWLTPEYRELASSYGFNDDDLKDLANPEEFKRATKLIDRQLMAGAEAFRQSQTAQPPATPPAAPAATPAATQSNATAVANAQVAAKLAKLDVEELRKKGFDEDSIGMIVNQNQIIDEFTQLQTKFEQVNAWAAQQQQFQQVRQAQQAAESFHDAVDGISDTRFGKSLGTDGRPVPLTAEQDAQRRKLYETAETLAVGIVSRARAMNLPPQLPPLPALIRRAHQLAFGDDIRTEERGKVHQEIREQSLKRRPVAAAKAPNGQFVSPNKTGPRSINDLVNEVTNNPDVVAAYNKALEASGAAA